MDLFDYLNVRRIFRTLAREWKCPVLAVKVTLYGMIDHSWEKAMSDSAEKALWDRYFPNGKPTPGQYVLLLGHAYERGEEVPFLLKE